MGALVSGGGGIMAVCTELRFASVLMGSSDTSVSRSGVC